MSRRDVIPAVLLIAALLVTLLPLAPLGLDPHHDGVMLKPAMDVRAGQVLFRDSFTQYGALTTYLQVLALSLHSSLLSLRLLTVVAYGAGLLLLYGAWRQFLPRSLAILSGLLYILFIPANELDYWHHGLWPLVPWSSVFAIVCQGLALVAWFQLIRGRNPAQAAWLVGLSAAAAFWFRQPVGVLMTGAIGVIWLALAWTGWKPDGVSRATVLGGILKGTLVIHLPLLALIVFSGALPAWWYQNFIWPKKWSGAMDWYDTLAFAVDFGNVAWLCLLLAAALLPGWLRRFRPTLPRPAVAAYFLVLGVVLAWQHAWTLSLLELRAGGWTLVFCGMILLQAAIDATLIHTRRHQTRPPEDYLVGCLSVLSVASLAQLYPSADPWHVAFALAPTCGLLVYAWWRLSGWSPLVVTLAGCAVFLPSVAQKFEATRHALARPLVTLTRPEILRGMRVTPEQAHNYERLDDLVRRILRQQPDIPGVVAGNDALPLCFLSNLTNPTPYFVTWSLLSTDADNQRRLQYIYRTRPVIFFQRAENWNVVNDFYRSANYLPVLYVESEAMEVAVPRELATAMGIGAYGARPAESPAKP